MLSGLKLLGHALGFECRGFSGLFLEFINGASRVNQVLFAGVERVAIGANFNMQLLLGGTGLESVATGANYLGIGEILWVEVFFHSQKILT